MPHRASWIIFRSLRGPTLWGSSELTAASTARLSGDNDFRLSAVAKLALEDSDSLCDSSLVRLQRLRSG